jgi:endonuclease YncB( thermonuclease family)
MNAPAIAAFSLVGAVVVLTAPALRPQTAIVGTAQVIDGDSIIVAGQYIRLYGIDAPEIAQPCTAENGESWPCGRKAKAELTRIIGNEIVSCRQMDRDRYERAVAICTVGEIDIGQALVNAGYAISYKRYSHAYDADETAARLSRRGIWIGQFVPPEIWRMQRRGTP